MRRTGLLRHPDFLKLWAGQTVSMFGSQVTSLALPLTAVLVLGASPGQMGLLGAAQYAPFLLVGLFAGVWVDRLRRRPILIGADAGRAVLIGSIPAAAALDVLRIEQLFVVGFLNGILTVFFDVAYQSFLPSLVERAHLVEGNSRLETSRSAAQVTGPGLAGALVQAISATSAMALDALSYVVSALFLSLIRTPEPPVPSRTERRSIWAEIGEGLRMVVRNPVLRATAACTGSMNLFGSMMQVVFVIYVTRELGFSPSALGLIFAMGGCGALMGALLVHRVAARLGVGWTIVGGAVLLSLGVLALPLVGGPARAAVPLLGLAWMTSGAGGMLYNINQVSLRQAITPDRLQGRMNATMRFLIWGVIPIGALTGGALGEAIGLRPTLFVTAGGPALGVLWLLLSPVPSLRRPPAPAPEPPIAPAAAR